MFQNNKISKLMGLRYPIFQGGMAWASSGKLACAVSNAGGLGILGCAGRKAEWVLNEIEYIKNNTLKPIGLNVALNDKSAIDIVELAVEHGIKYFTMGGANTYLELISRFNENVLIIPVVGSSMEAKLAERAGAKLIVCEGQESGGSIGRLSLFSLLPQVVDAVKIPVIAAGGIADSRGMRAAFALGAEGVQMGTRFLASKECHISEDYKNRIIKAKDIDSIVISRKIKHPTRVIKNKFAVDYLSKEREENDEKKLSKLVRGRLKLAVERDADFGALHAGEISGLITDIKSARETIEEIVLGFSNGNSEYANINEELDPGISKYLMHKPPILLVDKILDLEPGIQSKTSLKLGEDKWFFSCHYPDYPVMPGTLLLEAMSQTLTLSVPSMDEFSDEWGGLLLLGGITDVKFKKEALPGIELLMTAKIESFRRGVVKGDIKCEVDGELICSCIMTIIIPNAIKKLSNQIGRKI